MASMPMVTMIQVLPRWRVEPSTGRFVARTHTFHLMEQLSQMNMRLTEMDSDLHWTLQIHWVRIKYQIWYYFKEVVLICIALYVKMILFVPLNFILQ